MDTRDESQPIVAGEEFAKAAARIAHDNHAADVVVLDLRGISPVADFFVIAGSESGKAILFMGLLCRASDDRKRLVV